MARKTKEESQLTRERILDAAEQIFYRHGVDGATIASIADMAGVSRGAVYGHYRSKVDICLAMCRRAMERAALPPHLVSGYTPGEALFHMGMYCLRQWLTPGSVHCMLRVLYTLHEDTPESAPLKHLRCCFEAGYRRQMLQALRRAVRSGELPALLNLRVAQDYINCTVNGVYNARSGGNIPALEDWDNVARIVRITLDALRSSRYLRHGGGENTHEQQ